jgi:hypothetical protein
VSSGIRQLEQALMLAVRAHQRRELRSVLLGLLVLHAPGTRWSLQKPYNLPLQN